LAIPFTFFRARRNRSDRDPFSLVIDIDDPDGNHITDLNKHVGIFHVVAREPADVNQAGAIWPQFDEHTEVRYAHDERRQHGPGGEVLHIRHLALERYRESEITNVGERILQTGCDRHEFGSPHLPAACKFFCIDTQRGPRHRCDGDLRHDNLRGLGVGCVGGCIVGGCGVGDGDLIDNRGVTDNGGVIDLVDSVDFIDSGDFGVGGDLAEVGIDFDFGFDDDRGRVVGECRFDGHAGDGCFGSGQFFVVRFMPTFGFRRR
jgi:hypothetical protein